MQEKGERSHNSATFYALYVSNVIISIIKCANTVGWACVPYECQERCILISRPKGRGEDGKIMLNGNWVVKSLIAGTYLGIESCDELLFLQQLTVRFFHCYLDSLVVILALCFPLCFIHHNCPNY